MRVKYFITQLITGINKLEDVQFIIIYDIAFLFKFAD